MRACTDFNPRSHEGNDDKTIDQELLPMDFNPRSHEGNDSGKTCICCSSPKFQSTFPRGERRLAFRRGDGAWNFNPRSHEGNDPYAQDIVYDGDISIHVPTRGTTRKEKFVTYNPVISIHVPTRGTTDGASLKLADRTFQSTFPRGERRLGYVCRLFLREISIHVPTRGTT